MMDRVSPSAEGSEPKNARGRISRVGQQVLVLGVVPLIFLCALLICAALLQQRNTAIVAESERAATVVTSVNHALHLLDAANRDVVLHPRGSTAALPFYDQAQRELPQAMKDIIALTDDPAQHARAVQLQQMVLDGLAILREFHADATRNDVAAEQRLGQSPRVKQIDSQLSPLLLAFADDERSVTQRRIRDIHGQTSEYIALMLAIASIAIVSTLWLVLFYGVRISRKIALLARNAELLAQGQPGMPIRGNDELSQLNAAYDEMATRIRSERDRSSALQEALLPRMLPALPGLRVDVSYLPAKGDIGVGGDWYDVFQIDDRHVGISIGDVAGHGLEAASRMATVRHAIRATALQHSEPALVLNRVNQLLYQNEPDAQVSAIFATFNLTSGELQYCVAGHPAPMLIRTGGSVSELSGSGIILGVDAKPGFVTHQVQLDIGSALLFYTDGVIASDGSQAVGMELLRLAVEDEYRNGEGNIAAAIQQRLSNSGANDDRAIVFIGVTALGDAALQEGVVSWQIDAKSEQSARRVKRALLWHLGEITPENADLGTAELIVSEMLGNVARHTPGPATVTLEWKGDVVVVHVSDEGPHFTLPAADVVADVFAERGRGIFLMRAMATNLTVEPKGSGNCVTAQLPVDVNRERVYSPVSRAARVRT